MCVWATLGTYRLLLLIFDRYMDTENFYLFSSSISNRPKGSLKKTLNPDPHPLL